MDETTTIERPAEPDWATITADELVAYRDAENRFRASPAARAFTGEPDPGAWTRWQEVPLPGRTVPVRVHRPSPPTAPTAAGGQALPLVLHVHGGGFVGTAVQSDWVTSHVAARLPAVVVSVEHRLLDPGTPLSAAVDDAWDVLQRVTDDAAAWGVDPDRVAVFGESCGALIVALAALRARDHGPVLRTQVLVNPAVDVTGSMLDHASVTEHASTPTLTVPQLELFRRLAVPPGTDAHRLSPLHADVGGLASALVVVPTDDPLADHGRRYAERLRDAGTPVRLIEHPGAPHAFLSLPVIAPQAQPARAEILAHLGARLTP